LSPLPTFEPGGVNALLAGQRSRVLAAFRIETGSPSGPGSLAVWKRQRHRRPAMRPRSAAERQLPR